MTVVLDANLWQVSETQIDCRCQCNSNWLLLCDQTLICGNNWLLNLNLICETLDCSRKWLVDFNAGKTQLVSFHWSNYTGAIDVKIDYSFLKENSVLIFRCWGRLSLLSYLLNCIQENWSFKNCQLIIWNFLLLLLCISINLLQISVSRMAGNFLSERSKDDWD